jgi:hypothetical protein
MAVCDDPIVGVVAAWASRPSVPVEGLDAAFSI